MPTFRATFQSSILWITPSQLEVFLLSLWFQRYSHFSAAQNNGNMYRKFNTFNCSILISILASSDSFCLIPSHLCSSISCHNKTVPHLHFRFLFIQRSVNEVLKGHIMIFLFYMNSHHQNSLIPKFELILLSGSNFRCQSSH